MCNWSVQMLWQILEKISAFYQGILRCGFYMIWWDLSSLLVLMGFKYLILIYCATTNSVFWKNVLSILTASSKVFHELLQILHLRKTILICSNSWNKTNKMIVRPAKTQISLGIRPVWSEFLLSAWRKLGSLATHWAYSEDSEQTGRMARLIWVFTGCTVILLVLSWGGSFLVSFYLTFSLLGFSKLGWVHHFHGYRRPAAGPDHFLAEYTIGHTIFSFFHNFIKMPIWLFTHNAIIDKECLYWVASLIDTYATGTGAQHMDRLPLGIFNCLVSPASIPCHSNQ